MSQNLDPVGPLEDTVQVFAFVQKGTGGAPPDQYCVHLSGTQEPLRPIAADWTLGSLRRAGYAYWAISHPDFLAHVYFEGPLPSDPERDCWNQVLARLIERWWDEEIPDHSQGMIDERGRVHMQPREA